MYKILSVLFVPIILAGCTAGNVEESANSSQNNNESGMPESPEAEYIELDENFAAKYIIDTNRSEVNWQGEKKLVNSEHYGTIDIDEGQIWLQEGQLAGGWAVIDMSTINSQDQEGDSKDTLETHLKSADFFEVETYPTARIDITRVKPVSLTGERADEYEVTADLTIKDATNEVVFPAEVIIGAGDASLTADLAIDRSRWNVKYGSESFFKGLGDKVIDDNIDFSVKIMAPITEEEENVETTDSDSE